ncbi:hypothetical protein C7212DRAFT_322501 [Tuber magnatum]|uniref:Uncharacterized protein n=1 Tax=Tuber magnatum TaxID=42249 RepID=A0A317SME8_9PEZI|nr:hypothetical protein C7212DRAFT_322501 [Tuber magnatum]
MSPTNTSFNSSLQLVLLNISILSYISTYKSAESIPFLVSAAHIWILISSILAFLLCFPKYYSPSTCFRSMTL